MNVLFMGFKGKNNTANVILDKMVIKESNKLYLTNSFETSVKEFDNKLANQEYDLILAIGQLKLDKNVVRIERCGRGDVCLETNYNYSVLKSLLEENSFIVEESSRTNYLCNNIYYHGLEYIRKHNLKTMMIFVHVPKIKNIDDIDLLAKTFLNLGE